MKYKGMILQAFKEIDHHETDKFLSKVSPQINYTIDNTTFSSGRNELKGWLDQFYSKIYSISHDFVNVWEVDDTYILTADLIVTLQNEAPVSVDLAVVVKIKDELMYDIELYPGGGSEIYRRLLPSPYPH